MNLKLEIELVPRTAWYSNLRKYLKPEDWDTVRRKCYKASGHRCDVCGAEGRLNCHEIWAYDDRIHVQTLTGVTTLCDSCHMIKHIGFAGIQAKAGKLDMDLLVRHFMAVNAVSVDRFKDHKDQVFKTWNERSKHGWRTDLSYVDGLISDSHDA